MDKTVPIDVIVHLNVVPFERDFDNGWTVGDIRAEFQDFLNRLIRMSSGIDLDSVEVEEVEVKQA